MPRTRTIAAFAAMAATLAACRDDGRTLAPAPTVPVSQITTTTAGVDPGDGIDVSGLTLTSPAFVEGALIDAAYTCDGINVPPPLALAGIPEGTAELAIVVTDRDAAGFVHWVVAGIPPTVTLLESGIIPPGAVTARTDTGANGWDGPCPPPGGPAHTYDITLYAMTEPIGLAAGLDGRAAIDLIEQAAVQSDVLSVTYASPASG